MKVPIHVICRHATALGVALAGVAPIEAETGAAAATALGRLPQAGVILIEAPLHAALPAATRRQLRRAGTPIVMPFPGPAPLAAGAAAEDEMLDLLRRAVGYRMRLA